MGHSGAISYFVRRAAREGLIGLSICQSDPMVVPFGGADIYYGTNPLAFAAPGEGDDIITFDMATTVQAREKSSMHGPAMSPFRRVGPSIKMARRHMILCRQCVITRRRPERLRPDDDDRYSVRYSAGAAVWPPVSSMYEDLHAGRNLGQLHLVINPAFFSSCELFRKHISQTMQELNSVKPAPVLNRFIIWTGSGY